MKTYKQSGVSLIEILVTTLVLGIGLLGVAALQVSSISSNQEGFFTSQATSIAEDYASRVRSGRLVTAVPQLAPVDTATVRHMNFVTTYVTGGPLACGNAPTNMCRSNNGTAPGNCDAATLVAFEKWEICDITKNTLPDGKIRATRNGNKLTVVVDWDSAKSREDLGTRSNVNENCVTLGVASDRNCVIVELVP